MKINTSNAGKIAAAISSAEGVRVTARTLAPNDILAYVKKIEAQLSGLLLKADWKGLKFIVDPHAQSFPGAYQGTPESTGFTLERGSSAWFITSITRGRCAGPESEIQPINISEKSDGISGFVSQSKNWVS